MSQEYSLAIIVVLGSVAKMFGLEIENSIIEGIVLGVIALWIAIRRKMKGDITILGVRR